MRIIIPENVNGKAVDLDHQAFENTIESAEKTFARACARLLNPTVWHLFSGDLNAKFKIHSSDNLSDRKLIDVLDYLEIDITGPDLQAAGGYDWVQVEMMEKNTEPNCDESLSLRLRASKNPTTNDTTVAHFFTGHATSTFIIKRNGNIVSASYHGRNEMPNKEDNSPIDTPGNNAMAIEAKAGLSNLQWDALIRGFLQPEIGG